MMSEELGNLLQVCSDVHLERGDLQKKDFPNMIQPVSEILVLAGDIGDPYSEIFEEFIHYCSQHFKYVLFVSGNHEYYQHSLNETDNCINTLFGYYTNVIYLNNRIFEYEGITFVGSTLWTFIPEDMSCYSLQTYNDFIQINDFSSQICNKLYETNLQFIRDNVLGTSNNKYVVITHHAPSYKCISEEYLGSKLNCCFASHLDNLLEQPNILGWIYGHTHYNIRNYQKNKFLYANCYRTENYDPSGVPL